MIHSCAGGVVHDKKHFDFAKVEILDTHEPKWYICNLPLVKAGDIVVVPYGKDNQEVRAKVLRIDKDVSEQVSPVPTRHAKEILRVCDR